MNAYEAERKSSEIIKEKVKNSKNNAIANIEREIKHATDNGGLFIKVILKCSNDHIWKLTWKSIKAHFEKRGFHIRIINRNISTTHICIYEIIVHWKKESILKRLQEYLKLGRY